MEGFDQPTRLWFEETFHAPTPVQSKGWPEIARGTHSLLLAPTGSGKTLAAFLWAIDLLGRLPADAAPGVRVVYVSPLKALVYDVERNLRVPLLGIAGAAHGLRLPFRAPRIDVRTGDTTQRDRRRQSREPAEILVTTPESLYLMLGSKARETFRSVETVIVDEVHALAPTKRGAHLALSLERLARLPTRDPQRIGLSATARPTDTVARFLGGDRPVRVIDAAVPPRLDLSVVVPAEDMSSPARQELPPDGADAPAEPPQNSIWPLVYPRLLELIRAHRTTIVFVNSRGLCERLAQRLNDLAVGAGDVDPGAGGVPQTLLVRAHHGSLAHEHRRVIEEDLKAGRLRALVATSSLELGIDMGTVDLVVMVESPAAVSSGLQRIGRAGHGVGRVSIGRIFPKHRGDLLKAAVVAQRMVAGDIEPLRIPNNPLDVLAQQVVAASAAEPWAVPELFAVVRRSASFRELPEDAWTAVLDMLSGRYPSTDFADLRPRINWNRETDMIEGRRGARALSATSGGTIPDRGLYTVHVGADGPRVGELDEEMVHETIAGQTFTLGASTWRVVEITRDRVIVQPAPGEPGRLPFWHGEGPGRPIELGRAIGAFVRDLGSRDPAAAERWLIDDYPLDALAARNLVSYVAEQREATGCLPTDRAITVERFRDELGDWRVCILTPFGARVHAPWALALSARLGGESGFDASATWSDDGIVLSMADGDEPPDLSVLVPNAEEVEELVVHQLGRSAVFASQFRENAARALLLPRRRPGARTPLWQQRLRAQKLLAVTRSYPSFPIVIETYRACMQDVFDLHALRELLRGIARRDVVVDEVETPSASPFARSLVFAYVAANLYEGDTPLAERRAQALALDRNLLRELLGAEELRELLDATVMAELEAELSCLAVDRRARHADGLHDVLRRVGDLSPAEVGARSEEDPRAWLDELLRSRRAVRMKIGGDARWIAIEDVALYRDALECSPPAGVPRVFLEPRAEPMRALVGRFAATHGPFTASAVARRYHLPTEQVVTVLSALEAEDRILRGDFLSGGSEREWCDAEVLRRIKRRTLAKLRKEVAPVERATLARFLPAWHGIGAATIGRGRLEEAVLQLEGLPLSCAELERVLLPSRVRGFSPQKLDELGAMGWLVWVGHGALGPDDGRIGLYRREQVGRLLEPPEAPDDLDDRHCRILSHLERQGASFFAELETACRPATRAEALDALWDLVWAGLVTNDTFQALRALRNRKRARARRRRGPDALAAGGRWSLVRTLLSEATSPTERAHARAMSALERHGIVSREVAALDALPGGFSAIYRVLRAMEEAGKVRRGYFVEGIGGAQFAFPGAVDRLRAVRRGSAEPEVVLLSAVDPANPFGWILPWPEAPEERGAAPRRVAGATVVLVDGRLVLYLDRGGRRLRTYVEAVDRDALLLALGALEQVAKTRRGKLLRIEQIDGEPARTSRHAPLMREARFTADHKGLILEAG